MLSGVMFGKTKRRAERRPDGLTVALLAVMLVFAFLMVKASSDELPSWLQGTIARPILAQFPTGNGIIFNTASNVIVSVMFYFLVVALPESVKRRRIRRHLQYAYDSFKEKSITTFLAALGQPWDSGLIDSLKDREQFRQFFKARFSSDQDRWDAVGNRLGENEIRTVIVECEILVAEIHFALTVIDVKNQRTYTFLKELAAVLHRTKKLSCGYDDVKVLLRFLWQVHTGWSFVDGYATVDLIPQVIDAI